MKQFKFAILIILLILNFSCTTLFNNTETRAITQSKIVDLTFECNDGDQKACDELEILIKEFKKTRKK